MRDDKFKVLQFPVRNTGGGVTQYARNNWEYIDKSRFLFDFATCDSHLDFEQELASQGCKVHYISCYAEQNMEQFCREFNQILDNGYDAVHLHTSFWKSFIVEQLCREKNVPVIIVHSHNSHIGGLSQNDDREAAIALHNQKKMEFSKDLATHFCACSPQAADWLFGQQIPRNNIQILPNTINTEQFAYQPEVRRRYRKELSIKNKFVIGHVGRFEYQKNHDFLIDVFYSVLQEMPNAVLLSIGVGELYEDSRQKCDRLGISNRVLFLGKRSDVSSLYQAMDCFCLPSRFEGLAIVLIEAQCAGLPTLVSQPCVPQQKITNQLVGLPFSVDAWRNEIINTANQQCERLDYSWQVANAGYAISCQIRQLEKIYANKSE